MGRCWWTLALALSACHSDAAFDRATFVDARCHDAFWLWSGVRSQRVLDTARRVYVLYGEVRSDPVRLIARRPAPTGPGHAGIWLVVRAETLDWTPLVHGQLLDALVRWRRSGARVAGVQIDFDARTRHLDQYAVFLTDLRRRLPPDTGLSVTGLLDWSSQGEPAALAALGGTVDEVVLQLYQGRDVIPGHEAWLARLDRMRVPFRLGLPQGGRWTPPADLARNPFYRGTVVFLLNDAPAAPTVAACASE